MNNIYDSPPTSGLAYAIHVLKYSGPRILITKIIHALQLRTSKFFSLIRPRPPQFTFLNHKYSYTNSEYNGSSFNERSVEISLAKAFIAKFPKSANILEVGNVLSHYQPISHQVLDKFESGRGIIQKDILDYHPKHNFDLIISISTIEHIGFDDDEVDTNKIPKTFTHLKSLLNPQGIIYFTVPIGYNPALDTLLFSHPELFTKLNFLKRIGWNNQWQHATQVQVVNLTYSSKYNNAQAIAVGQIKN